MVDAIFFLLNLLSALILLAWTVLLLLMYRNERRNIYLERLGGGVGNVRVSVIVPARNEERRIASCLSSLISQRDVTMEVLLVDDESTDSTATITLRDFVPLGVTYIRPPRKPAEWQGKSWACWTGYSESRGELLLFVDSDTEFLDDRVVADAITYMERTGADAVSLVPDLKAETIASKTLLPTLWNLLYMLTPPARTNDPNDRLSFFFGAFILVKKGVYQYVGGHEGVRSHLLDDKALGERIKQSGFKVALLNAERRLTATFNETFSEYFNAMLRLFGEYMKTSSWSHLLIYGLGAFLVFTLPIAFVALGLITNALLILLTSSSTLVITMAATALRLRRMGRPVWTAPLSLVSGFIILCAITFAVVTGLRGSMTISWRGRVYTVRSDDSGLH